ncbi:NADP-dependent oxidoreductase [Frondihabitans australicus]|uniref:NADPH:quinone reductase-like Zn-dependent oxidoreductase n=1 Tax=Frondihabitans australicus TaxID=386892 RepID=A0A495IJL6_9MICO|nr:NADP-dependent oxidoreductase [Frondihabitans australicus]RKR75608.1 NADPH:quinone reductase-like Zn-dependent oxidoreductase [Frondihabitans australicus]
MAQKWIAESFGSLDGLREVEVDVPEPGPQEVVIDVRAVGMNPADVKGVLFGQDPTQLPASIGFEVAGVVSATGPDSDLAVGDEVLAFRLKGAYATQVVAPDADVFAKPANLDWAEAANLLLAGATAADMLNAAEATEGETILVHGASGAVGVSVLQQARRVGVKVIGTASEQNFGVVEQFGGTAVVYGPGLEERVRSLAPNGIVAALDCVGTDEAIDVSLALVESPSRLISIAGFARAGQDGFVTLGGSSPESAAFRDGIRQHLVDLAAAGDLVVPVARTFPFAAAPEALELLSSGHPGGKLALVVE